MTAVDQSRFVQRVTKITVAVAAVTKLLEHVAGLLRQAFHVAGWMVLLWGVAVLTFQTHPSPEHLIAPGTGVLAVLQGLVPAWLRHHAQVSSASPGDERDTDELDIASDVSDSALEDSAYNFKEGETRVTQA